MSTETTAGTRDEDDEANYLDEIAPLQNVLATVLELFHLVD